MTSFTLNLIIFACIGATFGSVIRKSPDTVNPESVDNILRPKSPTFKRQIQIPMIIPTEVIDLSQRIQRDQLIHEKVERNNGASVEAMKPNVEAAKPISNLGEVITGEKGPLPPLPNPTPIVPYENRENCNNEDCNCTDECEGGLAPNCTECGCGASGADGGCDLQNCADQQENCNCENGAENSDEEIDEALREKRCCGCCGCCDCCCCGCCCCMQTATMAPVTMKPCTCCCCCCGCCCGCGCGCGCGCCGGY